MAICKDAIIREVFTCFECSEKGCSYKKGPVSDWGYLQGEAALETLP